MECDLCGNIMLERPSVFYAARRKCVTKDCDVNVVYDRSEVKNQGYIGPTTERAKRDHFAAKETNEPYPDWGGPLS